MEGTLLIVFWPITLMPESMGVFSNADTARKRRVGGATRPYRASLVRELHERSFDAEENALMALHQLQADVGENLHCYLHIFL